MTALAWAESLGFELGQAIARGVQRGLAVVPVATLRPRTTKRRTAPRVARADVSIPALNLTEAQVSAVEAALKTAIAPVEAEPEAEARDVLGSDVDDFLDDDAPAGESFADQLRREVQADARSAKVADESARKKRGGFVGAVDRIREVAP